MQINIFIKIRNSRTLGNYLDTLQVKVASFITIEIHKSFASKIEYITTYLVHSMNEICHVSKIFSECKER